MRCDLHTHSVFSDGDDSVEALVSRAKSEGLILALTDHNTTKGLPLLLKEADRQGVTAVPGIELTTEYNGTELHLLGLFLDLSHCEELERCCRYFQDLKEQSNRELIRRLREVGYDIDYDALKAASPDGNINRVPIAEALMHLGAVSSIQEAFRTLLHKHNGLYVPPARLSLFDAIRLLHQSKALPILAHPLQELEEQALRALLPAAVEAGLIGMETQHSSYTDETKATAARIAEDFGLLPSGGSDYHGTRKPHVKLGSGTDGNVCVPSSVFEQLRDRHHAVYPPL